MLDSDLAGIRTADPRNHELDMISWLSAFGYGSMLVKQGLKVGSDAARFCSEEQWRRVFWDPPQVQKTGLQACMGNLRSCTIGPYGTLH